MKRQITHNGQHAILQGGSVASPKWFLAIPFFVLGALFSTWYLDAYYAGDNVFYSRFYKALYRLPIQHWSDFQRAHLGALEPLYRYVVGAAAYSGIDRVLYLSAWNGVFVGAIGYTLIKYRCSPLFYLLVFTNYYVLVLLGSAERLKFAYIALILAFTIENRSFKFVLAASSPFFHTQAMIQFASGFGYFVAANLRDLLKKPLTAFGFAVVAAVALSGVVYMFFDAVGESVAIKSDYYAANSSGVSEAIQWSMLLIGGLIVFKDRLAYFVGMVPMGLLTVLFGNRVNVATLALFVSLAILQRKTSNPIVLAVMAYMSFKSIAFISSVVRYGDGFVGG